jgi:hypothetical protein
MSRADAALAHKDRPRGSTPRTKFHGIGSGLLSSRLLHYLHRSPSAMSRLSITPDREARHEKPEPQSHAPGYKITGRIEEVVFPDT